MVPPPPLSADFGSEKVWKISIKSFKYKANCNFPKMQTFFWKSVQREHNAFLHFFLVVFGAENTFLKVYTTFSMFMYNKHSYRCRMLLNITAECIKHSYHCRILLTQIDRKHVILPRNTFCDAFAQHTISSNMQWYVTKIMFFWEKKLKSHTSKVGGAAPSLFLPGRVDQNTEAPCRFWKYIAR